MTFNHILSRSAAMLLLSLALGACSSSSEPAPAPDDNRGVALCFSVAADMDASRADVKRSLTKDLKQDKWVEMIWWASMEAAQGALEKLPQVTEFQEYCSALADEGTMMFHLEEMA